MFPNWAVTVMSDGRVKLVITTDKTTTKEDKLIILLAALDILLEELGIKWDKGAKAE